MPPTPHARWGFRSAVGVPISVEGRLWGVMIVASTREEPLSADTEERLAGFTELVATAIANAEAQAALTASRARIVATADQTRRRIERDLHDGAQQRLVSLALQLREVAGGRRPEAGELARAAEGAVTEVTGVLEELREIARGIHPAILAEGGLRPALKALARRSAVPVRLDIQRGGAAARAGRDRRLLRRLRGADQRRQARARLGRRGRGRCRRRRPARPCPRRRPRRRRLRRGSGLIGLKDRMEALGGRIWLHSPPGTGTAMQIVIPLSGPGTPGPPTGAASSPQ